MTEKNDEGLYCENCGSRLSINAEFCDECGCKIDHSQYALAQQPEKAKSGRYFILIGFLTIVILGIVYVMRYGDEQQLTPVSQGEREEEQMVRDIDSSSELQETGSAVTAASADAKEENPEAEVSCSNTDSPSPDTDEEGQADTEETDSPKTNQDDLESTQEDIGDMGEDGGIELEDEYIFPNSDSDYLKKSDIKGMSLEEINFAKNELYARHGRIFERKELQEYFESCSWYTPMYTAGEWNKYGDAFFFNKYEIKNRNFLVKWENKKR